SPAGRRPGRRGSGPPPVITRDQSLSRSRIDFEVTHIDLGQMYQEETRDLEFPFQCNGPDPITLFEPEVSCGCTAPSLEVEGEPWEFGKPIPPGAAGRVLAVFDSKKFQLDKASSIRILGNAVNLPVQLTLKAFILPLFQVSPRMARFDNLLSRELRRNDRPTRYLEVTGAKEFEILRWIDLPEWLEIREVEEPRPAPDGVGQIRKLEVALNPDVPVGRHSTMAMAETSLGKDLAIQVYAEVFGPVRYFPEAFPRFGLVQPGKTEVVRAVSIRATQDRLPIPAPRIEYQGDENVFEITLDEKKPGLRYDLIVGVLPEASPGRHDGKILLTWPEDSELPLEPREFDLSVIISQSN
ncbi:MAG: DUF1573 domain-containing protein, partial [Planctomycetota bacterium]